MTTGANEQLPAVKEKPAKSLPTIKEKQAGKDLPDDNDNTHDNETSHENKATKNNNHIKKGKVQLAKF